MIIDVKTKFYNIIKDLGYTIYDNPYTIDGKRRHLPYCQIRTNNIKRAMFQQNFINTVEFKVDISIGGLVQNRYTCIGIGKQFSIIEGEVNI